MAERRIKGKAAGGRAGKGSAKAKGGRKQEQAESPGAPGPAAPRDHWQLRFGGMGGQGVVVLGDTIALAGALAGWHAAASTSYGAQARGGASKADVVLSRYPIDYPHVERPDVMVLVSQEAYEAYTRDRLPPLVIADSFVVTPRDLGQGVRQVALDATHLALEALGDRQGSNFVMMGAFLGATGILSLEEVDAAVEEKMSKRFWDLNKQALRIGHEAVLALMGEPREVRP